MADVMPKMSAAKKKALKKEIEQPDDFDSVEDFLQYVRQCFLEDSEADRVNREAAEEDSRFMVGDQWDRTMRAKRERANKPVMSSNRLVAFVGQVTGNRRLNETVIKVVADHGGTKPVAQIREGIIRNIQKVSHAERAYNKALENCVICGIGNFGVEADYARNDVFEQDLKLVSYDNPSAVVWDYARTDPTGGDARRCSIIDAMSARDYKAEFGEKRIANLSSDQSFQSTLAAEGWVTYDQVRVVRFWRMRSRTRTLALLDDGTVADVTELPEEEWLPRLVQNPRTGEPIMREAEVDYAEMYIVSALEILDGPYILPIDRIPVFRVPGWEVNVGEEVHRFGLIRFMKDAQRMHNYWRSIIVEKLMLTPKAPWVAPDRAVEGREDEWRKAHMTNDPLLIYNAESGIAPQRTPPAQIEPALIQEAQMTVQDLRDISNLHEANLGMTSNEVSGRAIVARQRVGETGTVVYFDNLNNAIEAAGDVLNQLLDTFYDTPRVVKTLGPDQDEAQLQAINGFDATAPDITVGRYSVSCISGPNTATKRIEAAEAMENMVNAMPETMAVVADKIVEAQEWPGAEQIAKRIRRGMDPNMLGPEDITPEMQQQMQAQAQEAAEQKEMQKQLAGAELREKLATAMLKEAQAKKALADAELATVRADAEPAKTLADIDRMEAETALRRVDTQVSVAEKLKQLDQPMEAQSNG